MRSCTGSSCKTSHDGEVERFHMFIGTLRVNLISFAWRILRQLLLIMLMYDQTLAPVVTQHDASEDVFIVWNENSFV